VNKPKYLCSCELRRAKRLLELKHGGTLRKRMTRLIALLHTMSRGRGHQTDGNYRAQCLILLNALETKTFK
jgi:hypothetical protein